MRVVVDRLTEADDLVRGSGLHAGQVGAHVDLVDHHLHVHRVAGVGIHRLLAVAGDAQLDRLAAAAVQGEVVVAGVAGGVVDRVPHLGERRVERGETEADRVGRPEVGDYLAVDQGLGDLIGVPMK